MAAYTQCLRCAGAPRRPAGGSGLSLPFLLGMPLSMTPGSSIIASPELRCRHGLRRDLSSSALPILPQSVSRGARVSGLPDSRICYGLPSCSLSCTDQTDIAPRETDCGRIGSAELLRSRRRRCRHRSSGLAMIELPGVIESGMSRKNGQRKPGTTRGSPRRSRTAKASRISRLAVKSRCARG